METPHTAKLGGWTKLAIAGSVVALACYLAPVKTKAPKPTESQTEQRTGTHVEYTSAGTWSRKFTKTELVRVTLVSDREWQVCTRDPLTKEEVVKREPNTMKHIEVPWNTVWIQVSSPSQALEIEVKNQVAP